LYLHSFPTRRSSDLHTLYKFQGFFFGCLIEIRRKRSRVAVLLLDAGTQFPFQSGRHFHCRRKVQSRLLQQFKVSTHCFSPELASTAAPLLTAVLSDAALAAGMRMICPGCICFGLPSHGFSFRISLTAVSLYSPW